MTILTKHQIYKDKRLNPDQVQKLLDCRKLPAYAQVAQDIEFKRTYLIIPDDKRDTIVDDLVAWYNSLNVKQGKPRTINYDVIKEIEKAQLTVKEIAMKYGISTTHINYYKKLLDK